MRAADKTALLRIAHLRNDLDAAPMMLKAPIAAKLLEAYHQVLADLLERVGRLEEGTARPFLPNELRH